MSTRHAGLRKEIVALAKQLNDAGMMPSESGNLSGRVPGGFLITPTSTEYERLTPARLVALREDGTTGEHGLRPSSEWLLHAAIYGQRPDVSAIVHTHSPSATALSCAGSGIPAFHYMIALAGGAIRCAPYATFGSAGLAANAVRGLEGRRAVLLANHGVVAVGPSLAAARMVAMEVENLATQYLALRAAGMEPVVLDDEELERVVEKFAEYGRIEPG